MFVVILDARQGQHKVWFGVGKLVKNRKLILNIFCTHIQNISTLIDGKKNQTCKVL